MRHAYLNTHTCTHTQYALIYIDTHTQTQTNKTYAKTKQIQT